MTRPTDPATLRTRPPRRFGIGAAMVLVAGFALGMGLLSRALVGSHGDIQGAVLLSLAYGLGGLSFIGVPLLLMRRGRRPWGAGRILWFASGTSAWLLWPPIIGERVLGLGANRVDPRPAEACFAYGTPLMALYVTLALLSGRRIGRPRRRSRPLDWTERFGLILGLLWACTGGYVLYLIYRS